MPDLDQVIRISRSNEGHPSPYASYLWLMKSRDLLDAADLLAEASFPLTRSRLTQYRGQLAPTAAMLYGMSMECCLKALCLKTKGEDHTTHTVLLNIGHDLVTLADYVPVQLTVTQRKLLRALSDAIFHLGRYPTDKSAKVKGYSITSALKPKVHALLAYMLALWGDEARELLSYVFSAVSSLPLSDIGNNPQAKVELGQSAPDKQPG